MEDSKKKPIMIAVVVVCVALAVLVTIMRSSKDSGGIGSMKRGKMMWVKCSNEDCSAEYQMDTKDFYEYIEEHINPALEVTPALVCEECGEESVYAAVKCGECGIVFFKGVSGPSEYSDKCPECGYSGMAESRRKNRAE